ncbi:glycosyltransferase, partial [Salmonella enterica]|uniref:glycosyltransferase n=1 Tax=Salmonella enterica TaxID=28901 RepID=UPI00329798CD
DVTALRQQLGLPEVKKIVLYYGNICEKQWVEKVIDAAERLLDRPLIFAIVGKVGGKARMENMSSERGLANIKFLPL